MNDWRKRNLTQALKWFCYLLGLLLCFVLQQIPGFLQPVPEVKAVLIVPYCIAVAGMEGPFGGALLGAVGGLVWDVAAGRTAGFFALGLLLVCFGVGVAVSLFFRNSYFNLAAFTLLGMLLITGFDFLLGYILFHYGKAAAYYFKWILPTCIWSAVLSPLLIWFAGRIAKRFTVET